MAKYTQNGTGQRCVSVMKAASSGPMYGLMTMNELCAAICCQYAGPAMYHWDSTQREDDGATYAQMLILRACS